MTAVTTPVRRATAAAGLICFAATATAAASTATAEPGARSARPARARPRGGRPVLARTGGRTNVVAGRRAWVRGELRPARPARASRCSAAAAHGWTTVDRATTTTRSARFRLRLPPRPAGQRRLRADRPRDGRRPRARRGAGRLNVFRRAAGLVVRPGPVRQPLGCGGRLVARHARRRAQDAAVRHAASRCATSGRMVRVPRGRPRPVRGRPRVRPDGRDPRAAGLLGHRRGARHPLSARVGGRAYPRRVSRCIAHLDLDAFYASVELQRRPELRGLPVIVAGQRAARGRHHRLLRGAALRHRLGDAGLAGAAAVPRGGRHPARLHGLPRGLADGHGAWCASSVDRVEVVGLDEAYLDLSGPRRPARGDAPAGRPRSARRPASASRSASAPTSWWPRSPPTPRSPPASSS